MNKNLTPIPLPAPRARRFTTLLVALAGVLALTAARADVQVAGSLYINVDATTNAVGNANGISNSGSLGGVFDYTNTVSLVTVSNVNAIQFAGNFLYLTNRSGSGFIQPAAGMVGNNPLGSIECWALAWSVPGDQCMISWGARNTAANVALEYGSGGSGGMSHNGTGNDAGWDFYGGYPAPGQWHHLVYTSDGVRSYLYSDGALVNSYPPSNVLKITNSLSVLLGAQWNNAGTVVSTSPSWATNLALARIRVHSGTLSAAQILNNYNFEKAAFPPPPVTPAYLTSGPTHRYSFNEAATDNAGGQTIHDSVGTAHGTVVASSTYSSGFVPPRFTGRRLVFNGDISTSQSDYGYAYGALPAGLISANSANNGGSGELSLEFWYKNNSGVAWSWSRLFDAGSAGVTATAPYTGQAISSPGGFTSGWGFLDSFYVTAQNGNSVGQRQIGWKNQDYQPGSDTTATNTAQATATFYAVGNYQTDRHVVVTWKESTRQVMAYDNGYLAATFYVTNAMSALNDVNVWLGRSLNNDNGFAGEYEEVRFYNSVLTPGQVLGNFQVGPNTVNTGPQAASISTAPQSQSVNQGWPVSFYVNASGSPAVSYQWNRNGSPIAGATTDTYSIAAVAASNNGDTYSCTVSNNTGSANVQTSAAATLTVVPNVALPPSVLHDTKSPNPTAAIGSQRDNYDGTVGTLFTTGPAGAVVTHLGFQDMSGDGLNRDHVVSIYNGNGTGPITAVDVPAGTDGVLTNGYRYAALTNPVVLAPNSTFILQADVYNGDGDAWADLWQPGAWSPYFCGSNDRFTRQGRYGSHGSAASGVNGNNNAYGAPNLAVLPMNAPLILAQQSGVTQYVNLTATLNVAANGQAPMTCQWYKVGTPDTLVPGATSLALTFPNVQSSNEGNYYAIVNNGLGSAQSANIYLRVFADTAVGISQQPANTTVYQGFSASFSVVASGTPPIGYQWYRNGTLLPGATSSSYTLPVAYSTNNNDVYSCVVSNYANSSSHTLASSGATLTVVPNQAPMPQVLFSTAISGTRDNYTGSVGGAFQVGSTPAMVTHLGYYCPGASLSNPHHVGIYNSDGTQLLAEVFVTGSGDYLYNGYAYVALASPLTLAANTTYVLASEVYSGSGDPWPDVYAPTWNTYYIGGNPSSTQVARYSSNGAAWPVYPGGNSSTGSIYGPGNLAMLPAGSPVVSMTQTNQSQYATSNATFTAFVDGQPAVTVQWYKVGSPDTQVPGQTSSTLTLNNLQMSDAGTYYLMANNSLGSARGPNATLTVLATAPPTITQQPQSQTIYIHQPATFTVAASVAPQSYQWWFNNTAIPGATGSSYTVTNADSSKAGSYKATLVNAFGTSTSATATLTVLAPAAGSYADTVLQLTPLVYYPFNDLSNSLATGGSNVFNLGSLGIANTGVVEGSANFGPGPQPPTWSNFDPANPCLVLDGYSVDVAIPALNLDTSSGPNVTMAAWVSASGVQQSYAGIIFHRPIGGSVASGLQATPDPNTGGNQLVYHWANQYYTFASHVQVPADGTWTFVALVIQPDRATFYANSGSGMQTATNVATHAAVPFASTTYLGWDDNDSSTPGQTYTRRFNGQIDEPMIFGRALSPSEITQLFQAATAPVKLQISYANGQITLTWPSGVLQRASQVNGTYSDLTGVTSPYTFTPTGNAAFFRVRIQ